MAKKKMGSMLIIKKYEGRKTRGDILYELVRIFLTR